MHFRHELLGRLGELGEGVCVPEQYGRCGPADFLSYICRDRSVRRADAGCLGRDQVAVTRRACSLPLLQFGREEAVHALRAAGSLEG